MLHELNRIRKICSIIPLSMSNPCSLIFFWPENMLTMKYKLDTCLQNICSISEISIAFESGVSFSN